MTDATQRRQVTYENLLRCPFCGCKSGQLVRDHIPYIRCNVCLAHGPLATATRFDEEAAFLWNTRRNTSPNTGKQE